MGRLNDRILEDVQKAGGVQLDPAGELERMDARPENIPQHVWDLIRENGELATERLNELLRSPRFPRMKPADQARLIALAQNRAYGAPQASNRGLGSSKRRAGTRDVVQTELDQLVYRASLPEYINSKANTEKGGKGGKDVMDADLEEINDE